MQDETDAQLICFLPAAQQYTRTRTVKVAEFAQLLQEVPLRSSVSCYIELAPVSHPFESGEDPLSSLIHKHHWVYPNNGLYLNIHTSLEGYESTQPILNEIVDGLFRAEVKEQVLPYAKKLNSFYLAGLVPARPRTIGVKVTCE